MNKSDGKLQNTSLIPSVSNAHHPGNDLIPSSIEYGVKADINLSSYIQSVFFFF